MVLTTHIDIENAAELAAKDKEAFTLLRRKGFGASDSSILLGINKWTTFDQLIEQKNSKEITDDEIKIGEKPQVRMGADCEPIILGKFKDWYAAQYPGEIVLEKPEAQYRFDDEPQLTINYDGLLFDGATQHGIPVECKLISMFATKYWKFENALTRYDQHVAQKYGSASSIIEKINTQADMIGIPNYYYTQVQQQLLGTDATYAYLAAIDVKGWELHVFRIDEDEEIQACLIDLSRDACALCPGVLQ